MSQSGDEQWIAVNALCLHGTERRTLTQDHHLPSSLLWRVAPQRWLLGMLSVLLLCGAGLFVLDKRAESRHAKSLQQIENLESASLTFSEGYLHLNGGRSGLFQRARALTLLDPSLQAFEQSALRLPADSPAGLSLQQDVQHLRDLLGQSGEGLPVEWAGHTLASARTAVTALQHAHRAQVLQDERYDLILVVVFLLSTLALGGVAYLALRQRQRAEQRRRESEGLFRGVFEQSLVGVGILQEGRVIYANERTAEILGHPLEQVIGREIVDFMLPEYRERTRTTLDAMGGEDGGNVQRAVRYQRPDGKLIDYEVQATAAIVQGKSSLIAILKDVSEQTRLERERRNALSVLESLTESSGDAIFAKDLEGRYILINAQARRFTGKSAAEILKQDDRALFPPQQAARHMQMDSRVLTERRLLRYELELSTVDGLRSVECIKGPLFAADGSLMGLFGITRDITERKAQELVLEESRSQLESILESLEEGLMVFDPHGNVLRMNSAARRLTGTDVPPALGSSVRQYHSQRVIERLDGRILPIEEWPSSRLQRGEEFHDVELRLRHSASAWSQILSFNGTQVRAADGSIRFAVETFTDITQRKQGEAALQQAQRLESLGTLAAGIAHDFNNVLFAISGNTSLALSELPAGHPVARALAEIQRAERRASDLVRRILLFARADESRRAVASVQAVIEEALGLLRPTLPARIELRTQFATAVGSVNMDVTQIHQVIVNLMTNAAMAIAERGADGEAAIGIDLQQVNLPVDTLVGTRTLMAGSYVRLTVSDTGCGMDAAVLQRIFDPFFTTRAVGQGTGLGLAMVLGIVQEHGGAIRVSSQLGEGSRFEVYLPVSESQPEGVAVAATVPRRGSNQHVLYLDDEGSLVFLVSRYLRRLGYRVTGYTKPVEALAALTACPGDFDLVVSDLSMPVMSGLEFVMALKKAGVSVPVILMSGFVRAEDRAEAARLGVNALLLKPSTVDELGEAIDRLLNPSGQSA